MQGLEATFETLKATRNEAAIDVLIAALDDESSSTRQAALAAITARPESRAAEMVLANWNKLRADDIRGLKRRGKWMRPAVTAALASNHAHLESALDATESLQIFDVLPQVIVLAESSNSDTIKKRATKIILTLVEPLGLKAREGQDQATVRKPARSQLVESLNRYSEHRNHHLVDALIVISEWGDGDLRRCLSSESKTHQLICQRLHQSNHPSVINLLAGFIRRRKIEPQIAEQIRSRDDVEFRDALLKTITADPSATVLRNLHQLGIPESLRGGEAILDDIDPNHRAAATHTYVAANGDSIEMLHFVVGSVQRGGTGVNATATFAMTKCGVPEAELWMLAALVVAGGDKQKILCDPNAHLLQRLIDLLDHPEPTLVTSVRRLLRPLHADQILGRFESLRPQSRRRLGSVVQQIDPDLIERVRDALRHPVLNHRLQAIAMADALTVVDRLSDSFERIARQDHQVARMQAAEAMGSASGEVTLGLLHQMTELPDCPVKDAAIKAIQKRQKTASAN
ncbi:MAG: hypothetical protein ACPGLY_09220 [Rubripirellula sp.]